MTSMVSLLGGDRPADVVRRSAIIAVVSFLTLIDLFGAQALLPGIVGHFGVDPAIAGLAVNAATLGMAMSGMTVAYFADRVDRKRGIWISLALLAIPTALLSQTDSIWVFMVLRMVQGALMAAAFTLTMTYLSERCDAMAVGGALAAYISGNVASNLFGRLAAVAASDAAGLSGSFLLFAALNLAGAVFAFVTIGPRDDIAPKRGGRAVEAWRRHLSDPALRAVFAIGFLILFMFVGVFTYVNLHLVNVLGLSPKSLGLVYLVFAPAIVTTLLAGNLVRRIGPRQSLLLALAAILAGLALSLSASLPVVLAGLAVIGAATFFAQAAATGYVSRNVRADRAQANGLYLTSYYCGGLAGASVLGQVNHWGWPATAAGVAVAALAGMALAGRLRETAA